MPQRGRKILRKMQKEEVCGLEYNFFNEKFRACCLLDLVYDCAKRWLDQS